MWYLYISPDVTCYSTPVELNNVYLMDVSFVRQMLISCYDKSWLSMTTVKECSSNTFKLNTKTTIYYLVFFSTSTQGDNVFPLRHNYSLNITVKEGYYSLKLSDYNNHSTCRTLIFGFTVLRLKAVAQSDTYKIYI